ncbi:MAG: type II/IV secretion system protein [Candidatus Brennerbacteria bacterium]|nr:type II/IV secretion system protein [Candidatus Brennerbacteria bacterium]
MAQDQDLKNLLTAKLDMMKKEAEEKAAQRRAEQLKLPYMNMGKAPINIEALGSLEEPAAKKSRVAVIEKKSGNVFLIAFDPEQAEVKEIIKNFEIKGNKVKTAVVSLNGLGHVWEFYKFVVPPAKEISGRVEIEAGRLEELIKKLTSLELVKQEIINFKSPFTSQIFELILAGAMANRVSDIHLEAGKDFGRLRYRVDGILHDVLDDINTTTYRALIARIKLLSHLKLNVHTEAQDGRFSIGAGKKDIEMRTSVIPSEYGETIVLRILDPAAIQLSLEDLGMRQDDLKIVDEELAKPNGLILNTGPTGSGKTTTLYAFLNRVYDPEIKIITIEDPVEYHLKGISQTQVQPDAGYTFSSGLRSILRQDPDVILVGEIRDIDTAEIAMNASLTGHLVFSTLHTNSAPGAIPRLIDMGAKAPIIGPALNLVIAQRLLRKLCQNCRVPWEKVEPDLKEKIGAFIKILPDRVDKKALADFKIFNQKGCDKCAGIGYRGRIGVFELFLMNNEIEELLPKGPTEVEIRKIALERGMVELQQDGIIKTLLGLTTFDEVERMTGPIEW